MANAPLLNSINTLSTSGDFTAPDNELGVKGLFAFRFFCFKIAHNPNETRGCHQVQFFMCATLAIFLSLTCRSFAQNGSGRNPAAAYQRPSKILDGCPKRGGYEDERVI